MTAAPPGYEVVEELSSGARGTVYLARQQASGREVAIERIVGGASSQDPETVLRFERQARLLARLDHPGIVRVHEVVRLGADLYVVMERVPGTDLRQALASGPPPADVAIRYVSEIAAALDHAHGHGVMHGRLEPSAVLVREDGAVKVTGFGLAALLERQARSRAASPGAVEGLAYLAPELARGDLAVDRRADVYSLGVIAYEMLVGRVPFPVDRSQPYATVRAQMEEPPPRPGSLVAGFPPLLEAALLWALQKPPERRPATAGELAAAVREGIERPPTIGAYTEDGRGAPAWAAAGPQEPEPGAVEERVPRGRWRLPAALGVAGILLAAFAGLQLLGRAGPAAPLPLQVTGVTAATVPADGTGHCPQAVITLHATIRTNGGAGTIRYEWLQPDGRPSGPGQVAVAAGRRSAAVSLGLAYRGGQPAQGVAALHVLGPDDVYSAPLPVSYRCP